MMGGGGLVAFENGGPIRAFDGMFVDPTMPQPQSEDVFRKPLVPIPSQLQGTIGLSEAKDIQAGRYGTSEDAILSKFGITPQRVTPAPSAAPSAQQKIAGGGAPPPKTGGLGAFKMPEFPTAQYEAAMGMPMPTEAEIAGTRKRAGEEFEQTMPDRTSQLLNERILRKTEQLQKDKDMTFNEALFAAGAAVLSAPGGGGMKWAGEGLKAFGQTMAQGKKDIRKSQDLIDQANIDLAQAQSLRDQGKLAAADKAENKAFDRFTQGRALAQSDAALSLQQFNARVTAAKAPYEIDESQSKAEAQRALAGVYRSGGAGALTAAAKANQPMSAMEVEMAKARVLSDPRYKNASPETVDQMLKQMYGDRYVALPALPPLIRGAETGGATLPGT
jgi:hypothetical protein